MKAEEEKVVEQYREYNRGDVALGRKPNQQRSAKQRFALRANIEPGDIFSRAKKNGNFQFAWCPFTDSNFYYDLKEEGYKPVIEAEWILAREMWEWQTPEKDRWRWSTTSMLVNRDEFLMYRDEEFWKQEQANRLALSDDSLESRKEVAVEAASRVAYDKGIEVELEVNGKPNKAGVRRTTVS